MKFGFSTIACRNSADIASLRRYEPEVIEVCGCSHADWGEVRRVLARSGTTIGLHCAVPYDGWPPHFEITGPDPERRRHAFDLLTHTLRAAADAEAAYVVVHFPTVLRQPGPDATEATAGRAAALAAAQEIDALSRSHGIPVLLENVAPNPFFGTAQDYCWLFDQVPRLRMCLDFAHAHVADVGSDVYAFTDLVAPHVASMHVYNASPDSYRVGRHGPPFVDVDPARGWMDLERLLRQVRAAADPDFLILEYSFDAEVDEARLAANIERIRLVASGPATNPCSPTSATV